MKVIIFAFCLLIGCAFGVEIPSDNNGGNLHREKKDIAKLETLFGLKSKPTYQDTRPVYAPFCNCWRPSNRPYAAEDTVVVYPSHQQPRPLVLPAQPALIAPARVQPAQPAFAFNAQAAIPAAPAIYTADQPQPCPPGYSYDRPPRPFNS